MKKLLFALIMATQVFIASAGDKVALPKPDMSLNMTLMTALQNRHSTREFSDKEISDSTLATVLWAASGINRPEEGKITAPSAVNAQDILVYVVRKDGAYLYLPKENALLKITDQDLRKAVAGPQEFAATAPVSLVLVSDHSRFPAEIPDAPKATMGAIDAGYVSQNVVLVCTALGLNNVPRMTMDAASLKKALNLTDQQDLLLNHQIGYPKK